MNEENSKLSPPVKYKNQMDCPLGVHYSLFTVIKILFVNI